MKYTKQFTLEEWNRFNKTESGEIIGNEMRYFNFHTQRYESYDHITRQEMLLSKYKITLVNYKTKPQRRITKINNILDGVFRGIDKFCKGIDRVFLEIDKGLKVIDGIAADMDNTPKKRRDKKSRRKVKSRKPEYGGFF